MDLMKFLSSFLLSVPHVLAQIISRNLDAP